MRLDVLVGKRQPMHAAARDRFADRLPAEVARLLAQCLAHVQHPTSAPLPDVPVAKAGVKGGAQRSGDFAVPLSQAQEAFKISASQQCGKILLYPHRH